jgi:membrane associated rhomboid family serine protease
MTRAQVMVICGAVLLAALDGYDVLGMAFVAPVLSHAWHLGKVVIGLLVANFAFYVIELILLRANFGFVLRELPLSPSGLFDEGRVWQPLTYMWLHDPERPMHLIFNLVWLWMFGAPLEQWWGGRRVLGSYFLFGLGGAALTLLVGLLSRTAVLAPYLGDFWMKPHLGASGAIMGLTVAWGIVYADRTMNFFFLGEMKGRTFLWIIIGMELLVALSFDPVSSTSHFGGMAAAFLLCKRPPKAGRDPKVAGQSPQGGLWRPSRIKETLRRWELERQRAKIESELRVIQGGKDQPVAKVPPKTPKNGKGGGKLN